MKNIYFSKVKDGAIIPSKRESDAGYDIYANITEDIQINPREIALIPTGIASAFSSGYYMQLQERGSTGTKGMSLRCGVIDSNFRNQWFVPINNTTTKPIIISPIVEKGFENNAIIVYSTKKAIAQAVLLPVPKVEIKEIPYDELLKIESDRGLGMLGSSGK